MNCLVQNEINEYSQLNPIAEFEPPMFDAIEQTGLRIFKGSEPIRDVDHESNSLTP